MCFEQVLKSFVFVEIFALQRNKQQSSSLTTFWKHDKQITQLYSLYPAGSNYTFATGSDHD